MKQIIFLLIISAAVLPACKKILDTVPDASLAPATSYQSATQINAALAGIYFNLRGRAMYGEYYINRMTIASDETYFYNTSFPYTYFQNVSTDVQLTDIWRGCYQSINYANTLLENIDESSAGKVDAAIVRRAKGEALFLRGFNYFLLAQWWGDVPLQIRASAGPDDSQIARTPVKEVYDQIITDMTAADSMLYDQTAATFSYSERVTRTAVQGILARVCLFAAGQPVNDTKRFAEAKEWAKKVMLSNQHTLLSSYSQVFIDECANRYNKENIWEIGFNQNGAGNISASGTVGIQVGVPQTSNNGVIGGATQYDSGYCYGYGKLHPRLFYTYQSGDVRRDWNCSNYVFTNAVKTSVGTGVWNRAPAKWRREYEPTISRSQQNGNATNFPMLRYADVLLMFAEAENEVNGPTAEAYNAINLVRKRSVSETPIVDSISMTSVSSGYTSAPSVTATTGGGSGLGFITNVVAGRVHIVLTNQGSNFTSAPVITIGTQWTSGANYNVGTQVAVGARLYTVTTAGTATATAPTNTAGASSAATTGAVFTYAGVAATAKATISGIPVANLATGLSKDAFRKAIQDERMRELAFEALRQQDLKRWGILISTIRSLALDINGTNPLFPKIPSVVSELGVGSDISPITPAQSISEKDMFWPIPLNDILYNRKITQNPGY